MNFVSYPPSVADYLFLVFIIIAFIIIFILMLCQLCCNKCKTDIYPEREALINKFEE
jgi:hypothetical protein